MDLVPAPQDVPVVFRLLQVSEADAARRGLNAFVRLVVVGADTRITLIAVNSELLEPYVTGVALVTMVERLAVGVKIREKFANRTILVPQRLPTVRADLGQRLDGPAEAAPHCICLLLRKLMVEHLLVVASPAAEELSTRLTLELGPRDVVRAPHRLSLDETLKDLLVVG